MSGERQPTRRILGVVCGPPRADLPHWQDLIVATVNKHKHCLPNGINEEVWAELQWEFVSLWDRSETVLPDPLTLRARFDGVIFSGSKLNTTEQIPWLAGTMAWIRSVVGSAAAVGTGGSPSTPLLGICFGHQLIAKSLGGVVDFNPRGPELGTADAVLNHTNATGDVLWKRVFGADGPETLVTHILTQELHWQSVLTLPQTTGAVSFAASEMDGHQWVRYCKNVYGTQFHPEYPVDYMREIGKHLPGLKVVEGGVDVNVERREAYNQTLSEASLEGCSIAAAFVDLAINGALS